MSDSIQACYGSRSGSSPSCTIQQQAGSQQEHNTPHRKARGSLRMLVKRHLEGCLSENYHFLLRRSAAGCRGQPFPPGCSTISGLPFLKAASSLSLCLGFEMSTSVHKWVIPRIRTCYCHTRPPAGDGRPVAQVCHALIDTGVAGLKGGDGEGAGVDLQTREGVLIQGETSKAPRNHRRWRTH